MQIYSHVHVRIKKHEAFYMYAQKHNHCNHAASSLKNYKVAKWCWTYLDSHQVDGQPYMNQGFHRSFLLEAVSKG